MAAAALLAVLFVHDSQPVSAQAPGVPRPDQTELMHLGFYLWWEESSGASGYDIQIRSQSGGAWGQWSAVSYSGTTQPAIVTGLTHLTKYQWRIRATAGGQQSAWSTILGNSRDTRTATKFQVDKPNPPILHAAVPGHGSVTLRWEAGPQMSGDGIVLSGYRISYRWEDGQGDITTRSAGPFGPDVTSADVTGLTAGVEYHFAVVPLVDGVGGAFSRLLRATPLTVDYQGEGEGDTFTVSDVTVVEGGTANITVTLSNVAPSGGVAFTAAASYSTTGSGNAVAADVRSVAGTLTIAQGGTTGNLAVRARKDTLDEGAETFTVTVTTADALWTPAGNRATVTIHDPVRFPPLADNPSESRAGIGVAPESDNITLYFKVGQAVSVEFPAAHEGAGEPPYVYALGGPERDYQRASRRVLPGGLTFNAATRTLSGTPTGVDANGVTTLGSDRIDHYHVWDDSGAGGPDGDEDTEDNHDELRVRIFICPADSAATADGSTPCVKTADLYSLEVSHGDPATPVALSPAFDRDTGTYTASVAESVAAVDVSVLPEDLNADRVTMTVNGGEELNLPPSGRKFTGEAALARGVNVIVVEVTSGTSTAHSMGEDGDRVPVTETYTVTVTRASDDPVLQFSSATYSGTEGDSITIQLSLDEAQTGDFRVWVRQVPPGTADHEADFSFGDCYPGEMSCEFGIGVLDVTIPAGDTTYDYDISTIDDGMVEGSETFTLDLAYVGSPFAQGANFRAVVTIVDNDEAGVIVSTETVSMKEETTGNEEADATYTITLRSQPDDWVRVYPESAFSCKVGVIRGFVEFSRHNWDQPQTVRLRAEHDFDAVDEEVVISHRIEAGSRAAEYRTVTVPPVTVSVDDKHMPTLIVEKSSLAPAAGETVQYRVYLSADPAPIFGANPADCYDYTSSHTVTIAAASSDTDKVTVSPASVIFTADDYDPKTFYVTGVSAGEVTITHEVSGTDPAYTGDPLVLQQVAVSVPALQGSAQEPPVSPQEAPEPEAVQNLPGPVVEVRLAATADSLTVSWSPPETGAPPTRYIVHIAPLGGGKGETKTPKAKRTSVTFRGLEAGQTYRIFVRAQNQEGKGPRAKATVTLPEAPRDGSP